MLKKRVPGLEKHLGKQKKTFFSPSPVSLFLQGQLLIWEALWAELMHPSTLESINKEPQPGRNRDLIAWDGER